MANPTQVANKAIVLVGGTPILSMEDDTTEAIAVKAAFNMIRDKVLEARQWTFAGARAKLLPDAIAPEFGYSYRFLIPSNVIRILTADVLGGVGELMWEREGDYILADNAQIQIRYTKRVDDLELWSPASIDCLSYALASEIAMPLTENLTTLQLYAGLYDDKLSDAAATDGAQGRAEQLKVKQLQRRR